MKIITVLVHPQAKKNLVEKILVDKQEIWQVYLTTTPVKGKANQVLIKILSDHFHCKTSQIFIKQGLTTKKKLVEIY